MFHAVVFAVIVTKAKFKYQMFMIVSIYLIYF